MTRNIEYPSQAHMLEMDYSSDEQFMSSREKALWGTYGKTGREELHFVRVCDMSNAHLEAIVSQPIYTEWPITQLFIKELDYRETNQIVITN